MLQCEWKNLALDVNKTTVTCSSCLVPADANVERIIRGSQNSVVVDESGYKEEFDHVVLCCGAEQALKMLQQPSW